MFGWVFGWDTAGSLLSGDFGINQALKCTELGRRLSTEKPNLFHAKPVIEIMRFLVFRKMCLSALLFLPLFHWPAEAAPTVSAPLTLSGAMAAAPPPTHGILLAVGTDKIKLLPGAVTPPKDSPNTNALAAAFGEETQTFGAVMAVAPASRVVLNDTPALPDLFADLSRSTAFKMLAASLDYTQWAALTSERGLGLTDLTDPTQQGLFHTLFKQGHLWVASQDPDMAALPDEQRTDTRDVSDQISGVRLRLGQTAKIYLHDRAGKTIYSSQQSADAAKRLHTWSPKQDPPSTQHNVLLRAVIANTSKPSGLNFDDSIFAVKMPTSGLRTVEDLVSRIASVTHKEIYADPHYARRTLTIIGAVPASAADLLRSLALCVAGTYRQVGPAFVLTDDLSGVGTRRQKLMDWEDKAFNASSQVDDQAGAALLKKHAAQVRSFPTFGDPIALTPEQLAAIVPDAALPSLPGEDHEYPFAKLTPAQQDLVRRTASAYEQQRDSSTLPDFLAEGTPQVPDPTGPVYLMPQYRVQMLVPTVNAPVETSLHSALFTLFWPGEAAAFAEEKRLATPAPPAVIKLPPAPPLMPLLHSRPRRAIIGRPHTIADVDALVTAMQKIGLNELWLDVFSEGKAHLPGTGFPSEAPDILAEALKQTNGTGIAVYADLSLLPWGDAPQEGIQDLSIEGETSRELAVHTHERDERPELDDTGKLIPFIPPAVYVSPISDRVRKGLTMLVQSISVKPGLAGFVWEDAEAGDSLGYTPEMRLAFLRAFHADPLDITPEGSTRGDVTLPLFDDPTADKALPDLWDKARTQANINLLGALRSAAAKPILMEQSAERTQWLTSWDDPRQLPPLLRPLLTNVHHPTFGQVVAEAAKQGRFVLLRETVQDAADTASLARALQADFRRNPQTGKSPWNGFVLDFTDVDATRGEHPLAALVQAATK